MVQRTGCSTTSASWGGVLTGLLAAAFLVTGCAKGKSAGTFAPDQAAPASAASGGGAMAAEDIDTLEAELIDAEDALVAGGHGLPAVVQRARGEDPDATPAGADTDEAPPPPDLDADRCARVCDLAAAVCMLKDKICTLAADHANEERYQQACERADLDCTWASDACEGCDA